MDLTRLKRNQFLVLGRAGMDLYADPPGTSIEAAAAFYPALGGSAANIASAITKLGGSASLATTLSEDAVGRYVLRQLEHYGINRDHIRLVTGGVRTSLAVVETRLEMCQSVLYRNGASDFELNADDVGRISFDKFGALIVTGTSLAIEPSRSATMSAISKAKQNGLPIIIDIDYRPYSWTSRSEAAEICNRAVSQSDIVVGNDEEFSVLADDENGLEFARQLARTSASIVVYKMGEKGSVTFAGTDEFALGIYQTHALKPTGAGDAFMGGFATALAAGLPVRECIRRGSASAAIVVTRPGCSPANPTAIELDEFMTLHPPL